LVEGVALFAVIAGLLAVLKPAVAA
jgi:hypothetical protein